ncbi:type II toxin-antitoxin system HigB family toxin [Spirulina sp. 06S082]|uniref:type II toxin-antitoxin system HigB family toxin n=1 Tax=Spirulina sp. 06S082 TaxID=3110248 RepID=UPI002B20DD6E|nr:type II toxin-antitoxin system HigB family toxin [Spirulina sp. 06S082]MEA5470824.1 type II toxin-antitoxin system HigB family toxin [Spirulina sp. 06S082]
MKVINIELLTKFGIKYPDASKPLDTWLQIARDAKWGHLMDIKTTLSKTTDFVEGKTIFNIGGNKYRLITKISYKLGIIKIDDVLTHQEYDEGKWKNS